MDEFVKKLKQVGKDLIEYAEALEENRPFDWQKCSQEALDVAVDLHKKMGLV